MNKGFVSSGVADAEDEVIVAVTVCDGVSVRDAVLVGVVEGRLPL